MSEYVNRRSFIKGAAAAGVTSVAGIHSALAMPVGAPKEWDYTADVIIVGAGSGGLVGSGSAHESA